MSVARARRWIDTIRHYFLRHDTFRHARRCFTTLMRACRHGIAVDTYDELDFDATKH